MVRSAAWRAALERYRWIDRYLAGGDFERFTENEERRVRTILRRLGSGRAESQEETSTGLYPLMVMAGLALSAVAALVESSRARRTPLSGAVPHGSLRPVLLLGAGIVLNLALFQSAGFVIASTVLFWFAARAFDAGRPWRDLVFGLVVSTGCYLLFVRALKLTLPSGW
jgi:hypothetical protein